MLLQLDSPVGQGHAVEQAGQSGVYAEAAGAERPVPVCLTPGPIHRVKIVSERPAALPPARCRVAVRRRHHEVSAVDDLGEGQIAGARFGTGLPDRFPVSLGV